MFATKILLPALAVLGLATAQSTKCSDAKTTFTVASQADATALASTCTTISGSVAIASSAAGPILLDGIQKIEGDLTCIGAVNLTSLSGNTLSSIGGDMVLRSLTIMSTLGFPALTSVKSLQWTTLNALQELTFTKGLTKADSILITDTQLNDLNGISLDTIGSLNINNNNYLKAIKLNFANVTGLLNIDSNAPGLALEFPNLIWAFNMTLRNISSISIGALQTVNSTLGFYGDLMTSITAPNLTLVSGDLAVVANPNLKNISMPLLKTVGGGFLVANNTALESLDSFPLLRSTGAINFSGNFSSATLPSLSDVKGSFNMQSSGNIDCTKFKSSKDSGVIKGSFTCDSNSKNVQSSGTGTGSTASSTTTKNAAAGTIPSLDMSAVMLPVLVGFFAMVGGAYQML